VAVQAGSELQYRFIRPSTATNAWCNTTNVENLSGTLTRSVPAQPDAPYKGKTIYYSSGWNSSTLIYSSNGGSFTSAAMAKIGADRVPGESLFKVTGIGEAGESLQFVFTDGNNNYDKAPGGADYFTRLDAFHVQEGNVFSYQPPSVISQPQIVTQFVNSTATNIPSRTVRIYLPRGYQQNTGKRYPVVYLHDGQNVFDPGGSFGSWSADATATCEIAQGRMREAILVGVNNSVSRTAEYQPPNDSNGGTQGRADAYASFLINNVRPYVDATYRTLNDPKNTITLGSSMGGLVSLYLGREFSVFGKIGVFSPALWISPNYVATVNAGSKKPLRVYLDFGTAEPESDWNNALAMYDVHLAQGYSANADVTFVGGCGDGHNEAAWKTRLPQALHYLLPAREEPAELALRETPPKVAITTLNVPGKTAAFTYTSLFGFTYTLERTATFQDWTPVSTSAPESLPWANRVANDPEFPAGSAFFWRLRATPAP
jgi:predicted alpha/beta superfamily hydrolase